MAGEIFISYRRADEAWARLLHSQLQAEGVEAWYDAQVGPGQDWRISTAKALETSQIFVLLFSANAAQSSDIAKELAAATLEKKLIIPVRLENIAPKGAFLYELASRNWVNAFENTEAKLAELAKGLAHLVRTGARDDSVLPFDRSDHDAQLSAPPLKIKRKPLIIAAAMFIAVAGLYWLYPKSTAVVTSSQQMPRPADISVAVLPFLNLSGDPKEEFFSDGITEEITSALAKIPDLPVVGRTSAFEFKGKNQNLSTIGRALHANYLLEGSVRKAGDRVRITAQLIKAATGDHVWTDSYDRNLTDVFAVQEDVAQAIAAALRVPLGLKQSENLVANRDIDPASYLDYLRAEALFRSRGGGGTAASPMAAIALLEQVVARQPNYAPAWALLGQAYDLVPAYDPANTMGNVEALRPLVAANLPKAEAAAHRAITLDPRNVDAYTALGMVRTFNQPLDADQSFKQALSLDPLNPETLQQYSQFLAVAGRIKEALAMREQLRSLEPLVPIYNRRTAELLFDAGDNAKALSIAQQSNSTGLIAMIYAAQGRYKDAADLVAKFPQRNFAPGVTETAARLLRIAPAHVPRENIPYLGNLSWVFAYVGLPERALEYMEHVTDFGYGNTIFHIFWSSDYAAVRKTEQFKTVVRKMGLVDYWRAKGWPQWCHSTTGDDFACN